MSDIVTIFLTKGYTTVVSAIDADLARYKWQALVSPLGVVYARRHATVNGKRSTVLMHRVILEKVLGIELTRTQEVDHIDLDGTNNTRMNLRLATHGQNQRNQLAQRNSKSGIRGVSLREQTGMWEASIHINGRHIYLGVFAKLIDAARVRREAEREYFREFAPYVSRGNS